MSFTLRLPDGRVQTVAKDNALVGSDAGCDVCIPGLKLRQARIRKLGDRWLIEALEGTAIRLGNASPQQMGWLQRGTDVTLGNTSHRFVFDPILPVPVMEETRGAQQPDNHQIESTPLPMVRSDVPPPLPNHRRNSLIGTLDGWHVALVVLLMLGLGSILLSLILPMAGIVTLIVVVASAAIVGLDAANMGVDKLRLSRLPLNAGERQSAISWAIGCLILWVYFLPMYLWMRKQMRLWIAQTDMMGYFRTEYEMKQAFERPGVFSAAELHDMSIRSRFAVTMFLFVVLTVSVLVFFTIQHPSVLHNLSFTKKHTKSEFAKLIPIEASSNDVLRLLGKPKSVHTLPNDCFWYYNDIVEGYEVTTIHFERIGVHMHVKSISHDNVQAQTGKPFFNN